MSNNEVTKNDTIKDGEADFDEDEVDDYVESEEVVDDRHFVDNEKAEVGMISNRV